MVSSISSSTLALSPSAISLLYGRCSGAAMDFFCTGSAFPLRSDLLEGSLGGLPDGFWLDELRYLNFLGLLDRAVGNVVGAFFPQVGESLVDLASECIL